MGTDLVIRRVGALLLALAATGCVVGPDFRSPEVTSPAGFSDITAKKIPTAPVKNVSIPVASAPPAAWWTIFRDPELTSLEQRAAAANLDVQIAAARLEEARYQRQVVGSEQYPTANANGSYTNEQASKKGLFAAFGKSAAPASSTNAATVANGAGGLAGGAKPNSTLSNPFNLWSYGFDASWEPDFWGKVAREIESADASVQSSEAQVREALTTVLAEVARDYVHLRGVQRSMAITRENLAIARDSLRISQDKFAGGLVTELDVANARTQVATTAAQLPALEVSESADINQIAQLLGAQPASLRSELVTPKALAALPPTVPIGLPSDLLQRRPDIAQAEAQLHSATADIGVAEASFYPSITLSGSASLQALQFRDLGSWQALQYAIGPVISMPLFEGGRLIGTLELRKAQQKEAALTYQKTVLGAWHEVANALDSYEAEQRRRDQLQAAVAAARLGTQLARQRYQQGLADFLSVLDSQRAQLSAEQQLSEVTTNLSTDVVAIYKALGGGWEAPQMASN